MTSTPYFLQFPDPRGLLADYTDSEYPTRLHGWVGDGLALGAGSTYYGFVHQGPTTVSFDGLTFELRAGMYFCSHLPVSVVGGRGVVVERVGERGLASVGGPIEERGRLRYIDGCSDSLLVPPVLKGDACLNHLHFPSGISQTRHTHPTLRTGIVARGRGRCVVPAVDDGPDVVIPLLPGVVFVIPPEAPHSFFTDDDTMDVVAFHPDSDFGPEHDNHPMVNRTMVGGTSAARIAELRTTEIR